ncbi:MAG: flagellar biosynthesis anti-sigma factor FlgM, partial [Candidatus Sumerlaeota bacterium]|nr:flagellar biosynthesis anti-sigma factor FlgM [Candidatus Sumerlaeota bacterium]
SPKRIEEPAAMPEEAVSVDLSESSRDVRRAREHIATLPDVRMERVAELRDAIEDGSYQVESGKIARKMVDEALRESARLRRNGH